MLLAGQQGKRGGQQGKRGGQRPLQTERVGHMDRSRRLQELGEGRALEEGFACIGAESGWCLLCVRKSCFHGACSARAGSEAEQRAE